MAIHDDFFNDNNEVVLPNNAEEGDSVLYRDENNEWRYMVYQNTMWWVMPKQGPNFEVINLFQKTV